MNPDTIPLCGNAPDLGTRTVSKVLDTSKIPIPKSFVVSTFLLAIEAITSTLFCQNSTNDENMNSIVRSNLDFYNLIQE
jgi:hypothetical protein